MATLNPGFNCPFLKWGLAKHSFQRIWLSLGLELLTSYCSPQNPLLRSTDVFLPGGLWSLLLSLCLYRFDLPFSCHQPGARKKVTLAPFSALWSISSVSLCTLIFPSAPSWVPGIYLPPFLPEVVTFLSLDS